MSRAPFVLAFLVLAACDSRLNVVPPSPGLLRMTEQPRFDPYERTALFADSRTMRIPPEHSVPFVMADTDPDMGSGIANGTYVERLPIPLSRELLARGRERFDAICSNCHGVLGDGVSAVAMNLPLRRPPSLLIPRPPGRLFEVATHGYGFMPGFDAQLDDTERWAVVAYISALQLSASVSLDSVPEIVAQEARRALR